MVNDACHDCLLPFYKYVDDLTIVESRTCTQISKLQSELLLLENWSLLNNMKLNPTKCIAMTVSFMKNQTHQLLYIDETLLNEENVIKVLGVYIQCDLKWNTQVKEMLKKCNRKLYMLRTLKRFNLPISDLVIVYTGYIRPILEYCAPLFHSNLTRKQTDNIERIQKRACRIILGLNYETYNHALQLCNLLTLEERRNKLCFDFAIKLEKHDLGSLWLPSQRIVKFNLRNVQKYSQFICKTSRFNNSSIPYFVRILNDYY